MRKVKSLVITIGSIKYNLDPIFSYDRWDDKNAITIQAGVIPQNFFNRQRDFGIWPIPQDAYTGTIVYNLRAGGLTATDYITGTVTATENDATIAGSGTTFTALMVGRWFSLADTNGESKGSWYRVSSFTSATSIELETFFEETTIAGSKFIIGESPELPNEGHELLAWGAIADYYAEKRQSITKAQSWENKFYTGDFNNKSRDANRVEGGLINLIEKYIDRNDSQIIKRAPRRQNARDKVWASTISL